MRISELKKRIKQKSILVERFQKLAGLKPLYESHPQSLNEDPGDAACTTYLA